MKEEKSKFTVFFHKFRFANVGVGDEWQDRVDFLPNFYVVGAHLRCLRAVLIKDGHVCMETIEGVLNLS